MRSAVARARAALYAARAQRPWPARDDKILAAWNGLMLRALAEGARAFGDERCRALALANGEFLFRCMVRDNRVLRSFTGGAARLPGYLEDHAAVALGALALYDLTCDRTWLDRARTLGQTIVQRFWDDAAAVFYDTASDHEQLIARPHDASDNATPSGTSLAIELLLRLGTLFDDSSHRRRAERALARLARAATQYPLAFGHLLCAADLATRGAVELALVGDPSTPACAALAHAAASRFTPALVLAGGDPAHNPDVPLLALRAPQGARPTAYVCHGYACDLPAPDAATLASQLDALLAAGRGNAP
jgi:uncharacterized protein YyaL (SSP411 family)